MKNCVKFKINHIKISGSNKLMWPHEIKIEGFLDYSKEAEYLFLDVLTMKKTGKILSKAFSKMAKKVYKKYGNHVI